MSNLKLLGSSAVSALIVELAGAFIAALGAACSDTLGKIGEMIHTPSFFIVARMFADYGRSTIIRDSAIAFLIQWAIYVLLIFSVRWAIHHRKT